jgi:uroporphyrinogen decarboxylase
LNSRQRIINTLKGEKVDRVPIWLRDQFNLQDPLRNEMVLDVVMSNEFADGWVLKDNNFKKVIGFYRKSGGDIIKEYIIPGKVCNRLLCTPPSNIRQIGEKIEGKKKVFEFEIHTPKGKLTLVTACEKDVSTMWTIKHLIEDKEDLDKLLSIPFSLDQIDFERFHKDNERLGDNGVMLIQVDTPFIAVSGLMDFQEFLIMCHTDKKLLRELCDIAFERISLILDECLSNEMGPIYRLNGSEQATPPMNSPEIYEEFVYPYEKTLIEKIHKYGCFAAVHSHGKIRRNLPFMVDMKLDMLDPVEAPPSGDVEFHEAKEITGGNITLAGNFQFSDLESLETQEIRNQVKKILTAGGKDHVILNATASPITYMTDKLRDNYIAMIEAGLEYGSFN